MTQAEGLVRDGRLARCWWCGEDALYRRYHDEEWGRPVDDDRRLFEKICLEGFQSGLSWLTILRKREAFRRAFARFDIRRIARYGDEQVELLMQDASIVRHRAKIEATIHNARQALSLQRELGSLASYFWRFEPPAQERPRRVSHGAVLELAKTPTSIALSKDLKRRGWVWVGPTSCYAFMQAMGLVNDHLEGCSMRVRVERERRRFERPG